MRAGYSAACDVLRFATVEIPGQGARRVPGDDTMTVGEVLDAVAVALDAADENALAGPCVTVAGLSTRARLQEMQVHLLGCPRDEPIPPSHAFAAVRAAAELQALGVL